jgi:outer membrane lipoprotein-sorting protein
MMRWSLFILCVSLLLLAGCRTTRSLNLGDRSISFSEVQENTRNIHSHIHTMQGEGRISIETPDIAQSGSFVLTLQKPDSVLINLQGPFGIKVGSALVTRTEFFFYNSLENKLITGTSSKENLDRILHVQLNFDDLLNFFAGGIFMESDAQTPDETQIDNDQFLYIFHHSKSTRKYWVDPATLCIQKVQFLDQNGKLVLEQTFSDFETVNGFAIPNTIRILQSKSRQRVTLSYSEVSVNTDKLQFTFIIPPNAERITW